MGGIVADIIIATFFFFGLLFTEWDPFAGGYYTGSALVDAWSEEDFNFFDFSDLSFRGFLI